MFSKRNIISFFYFETFELKPRRGAGNFRKPLAFLLLVIFELCLQSCSIFAMHYLSQLNLDSTPLVASSETSEL